MLMPKRVKYRKQQRGNRNGKAYRGSTIEFGEYGLKALEPHWITNRQIEAARVALTRKIKRGGKVWIRIFPDKPVTKKPAETRMGKGKGAPEYWVAVVKPGRIMFELEGVTEDLAREALELAAGRWHDWFAAAPPVAEEYQSQYYYAWWVMRAGLISSRFYTTREAMTPSMIHYVGVWQWDAYFHALAYRHIEKHLAQDQIRIMLDHQRDDGMIPDAVHDEGIVTHMTDPLDADVTKPPLLAWSAWKLYELDGDREFLSEIYEPIVRCNRWWFEKSDLDGNGLCEYGHPFSSGLDDSPLWDDGMPVESPDLNTYLYLQQEALAKIAAVIGEKDDVSSWQQQAYGTLQRMLQSSWDAESGFFWATRNGTRVNVRTPFSLFPLLTGQLPAEISARLVAHLTDERQFWSRYPVPSVALNDPKYDRSQMWRGPTWVNVNYLLIEGLQRSGYPDLARELRSRTLALLGGQDDIYEYYDPESGSNPPKAASTFGWSSAVFIDLAIQATQENLRR